MIPTEVVDALSAYRLTRLVTADVIFDRPRAWIIRNAYEWRDFGVEHRAESPRWWCDRAIDDLGAPKLAELVVCRWCVSAYVGIIVVWVRSRYPKVWSPIANALALSAASALLARLEG